MSDINLKTDYVDDELDVSMSGRRRYNMIENSDGTTSLEDMTTYTTVGTTYSASDINATNTAVNQLSNNLNELGRKLLWENPSPNSPMNATTISVDFSGYDLFFIEYLDAYAEGNAKHTVPFMKDGGMFALQTFDLVDKWRTFTPNVSDNTMSITIGRKQGQYGTTSSNADDNTCLIPTRIFGFK